MKFAPLFLLLFCSHVRGHRLHCSTGVVITNQAVNFHSSRHAGAKVVLLQKYKASSLIQCLEDCCLGKHGACSVAEYKNNTKEVNCLYYSCQPISKCKFMDSEGTDTFTFPSISHNTTSTYNSIENSDEDHGKSKDQSLTESTTFHHSTFTSHELAAADRKGTETTTPGNKDSLVSSEVSTTYLEPRDFSKTPYTSKDHTRTISARKGVTFTYSSTDGENPVQSDSSSTLSTKNGDVLKSAYAVTMQDILSKTDLSFKNDNTTIKPRKGVDPEGELVSVKIKPRKGVEITRPPERSKVPHFNKSKVKPRKGVGFLPLSATEVLLSTKTSLEFAPKSISVAAHMSSKIVNQTAPSYVTSSSDLISVLEQVFRDESDTPEEGIRMSYSTQSISTSTLNTFSVSSTPVSSVQFSEPTVVPLHSVVTEKSSVLAFTDSPTMPSQRVLPSKISTHTEMVAESTPPLITVSEHPKLHSESASHWSVEMFSLSQTPVLQTSMNAEYSTSRVENTHYYDNSVSLFTVYSPKNKTKKPLMAISENSEDSENERKYKSSMHLVLSLVFGLLVLFVVLGAVAKRVYDVWMRRHYHRMDFLIDGMYDGFS